MRSWQFASWLIEAQGYEDVWNLEGGIEAWSVDVDPTVPRSEPGPTGWDQVGLVGLGLVGLGWADQAAQPVAEQTLGSGRLRPKRPPPGTPFTLSSTPKT
jgi:hypothetical protein